MRKLSAKELIASCDNASFEYGLSLKTEFEPVGGAGSPIKPAIYSGGVYQEDVRWIDGTKTSVIVIDNVAAEANRVEAEMKRLSGDLGLPKITLDLGDLELPPHLPSALTSFDFPHRNGDSYLRDSELDGKPFIRSDIGKAIFDASATHPVALYEWFPQALLLGFWQSHLGKKRSQAKLARSWFSEVIGIDPATEGGSRTRAMGVKGDQLNLSVPYGIEVSEEDQTDWKLGKEQRKTGKSGDSMSKVGHGSIPIGGAGAAEPSTLTGVSFRAVRQQTSVSFASLRDVSTGDGTADAAGRALLVSLGLLAHVHAFGRSVHLRSGCDLVPVQTTWTWRGDGGDEPVEVPSPAELQELFMQCAKAGEKAGLPVGSKWPQGLTVRPNKQLDEVIRRSWPLEATDVDY